MDVLEPQLTDKQAAILTRRALKHFHDAKRATIQVMADLRRLQNGGVHLLNGEKNFFRWAEDTFDGMSAGNAKQLARAGAVAIELEDAGRIDLNKPAGIGTTALRALSVIANDEGSERMVEVYDTARRLAAPDRDLNEGHIEAATRLLLPGDEPAAVEHDEHDEPSLDHDEDEDEGESELRAKVAEVQDVLWELGEPDWSRAQFEDYCREVEDGIRQIKALWERAQIPGHGPGCKPIEGSKSPRFPGEPQYVCATNCPRRRALSAEMETPDAEVGSAE